MELKIKNIMGIRDANIELKGVTLITGENSTGKSTISKSLFSIFSVFNNVEQKYVNLKTKELIKIIVESVIAATDKYTPIDGMLEKQVVHYEELVSYFLNIKNEIKDKDNNELCSLKSEYDSYFDLLKDYIKVVACNYEISKMQSDSKENFILLIKKAFDKVENDKIHLKIGKELKIDDINEGEVNEDDFNENLDISYIMKKSTLSEIFYLLEITQEEYINEELRLVLNKEMGSYVKNIRFHSEESEIFCKVSDGEIDINVSNVDNNNNCKVNDYVVLKNKALYINSEIVDTYSNLRRINRIQSRLQFRRKHSLIRRISPASFNKQVDLIDEIFFEYFEINDNNAISTIIAEKKVKMLEDIISKSLYLESDDGKKVNLSYEHNVIADGLKIFVMLKNFIAFDILSENDLVIFDEPEVHLHPKRQVELAELLLILKKEFKLNIVINTHSNYFANTILQLSKKYNVDEEFKAYITEGDAGLFTASDVTEKKYLIDEKMAEAYIIMDDIFRSSYNE